MLDESAFDDSHDDGGEKAAEHSNSGCASWRQTVGCTKDEELGRSQRDFANHWRISHKYQVQNRLLRGSAT